MHLCIFEISHLKAYKSKKSLSQVHQTQVHCVILQFFQHVSISDRAGLGQVYSILQYVVSVLICGKRLNSDNRALTLLFKLKLKRIRFQNVTVLLSSTYFFTRLWYPNYSKYITTITTLSLYLFQSCLVPQ